MNRWIYATFGTVGIILFILYLAIAQDAQVAFTILMITAVILSALYLYSERRFYRRHNAIPASIQFIMVPSVLLLFGNIVGPLSWDGIFLEFSIDLGTDSLIFLSTYTSLIVLVPILILFALYNRFYDGRYPGFVIRRQIYGPNVLPMTVQFATIALLITSGYLIGYIDAISLIFIVGSLIIIISKKIAPIFQQGSYRPERTSRSRTSRVRSDDDRRAFFDSFMGGGSRNRSSGSSSRSRSRSSETPSASEQEAARQRAQTARRRELTRSGRSQIPTRSSRGNRSIRTAPSEGYRQVSPRNRSSSRETSRSASTVPPSSPSRPRRSKEKNKSVAAKTRKVSSSSAKKYLPKGNVSRDDLKCIVCYEEFNTANGGNVILCPNCKFPAHEGELRAWLRQADRCPRCNKEVISLGALNTKSMVAVSDYVKIIRKI